MKVGVLTFHCSYNFGANLQALSLQWVLRSLGASPVFVNYREPHKMGWYARNLPPEQGETHEAFLARYLALGPVLTTPEEVEDYCSSECECILVGSDAVFRVGAKYAPRRLAKALLGRQSDFSGARDLNEISPYFLDWKNRARRAQVFSASVAASNEASRFLFVRPSLFPRLWRALRQFDALTVRDRWTGRMVRILTAGTRDPEECPDPVFALNSAFPEARRQPCPIDVSKVLLLSCITQGPWLDRLVDRAHRQGWKVANLPNPENDHAVPQVDIPLKRPLSPLAWYSLLANAAAFAGVRFHALVSCLANGTPSIALDRSHAFGFGARRSSKVFDLCRRAGVPERYSSTGAFEQWDPDLVVERLMDPASQRRANEYAAHASARFREVVSRFLDAASKKRESSVDSSRGMVGVPTGTISG